MVSRPKVTVRWGRGGDSGGGDSKGDVSVAEEAIAASHGKKFTDVGP